MDPINREDVYCHFLQQMVLPERRDFNEIEIFWELEHVWNHFVIHRHLKLPFGITQLH